MKKLFERLGLGLDNVGLQDRLDAVRTTSEPTQDDANERFQKQAMPRYTAAVAVAYYLLDDRTEAARHGKAVVPAACEDFFGAWRDKPLPHLGAPDPQFWKTGSEWMDTFACALGWGAAVGDWDGLRRLAGYPAADCPDEGKPHLKALYRAFAAQLLGRPDGDVSDVLAAAEKHKSTAPLGASLRALRERDVDGFARSLGDHLKAYRKAIPKVRDINKIQANEGTFLWHLARRQDCVVEVPASGEDIVIRL